MIALRQWVQRNRRNKWLFPLLFVILLLLVIVLAFHAWNHVAETGGGGVVCVLFGFLITVALTLLPPHFAIRVIRTIARAPPTANLHRLLLPTPISASAPLPLRL